MSYVLSYLVIHIIQQFTTYQKKIRSVFHLCSYLIISMNYWFFFIFFIFVFNFFVLLQHKSVILLAHLQTTWKNMTNQTGYPICGALKVWQRLICERIVPCSWIKLNRSERFSNQLTDLLDREPWLDAAFKLYNKFGIRIRTIMPACYYSEISPLLSYSHN